MVWSPGIVHCPECGLPLRWWAGARTGGGTLSCLVCDVEVPVVRMVPKAHRRWPKDRWHAIYLHHVSAEVAANERTRVAASNT